MLGCFTYANVTFRTHEVDVGRRGRTEWSVTNYAGLVRLERQARQTAHPDQVRRFDGHAAHFGRFRVKIRPPLFAGGRLPERRVWFDWALEEGGAAASGEMIVCMPHSGQRPGAQVANMLQ